MVSRHSGGGVVENGRGRRASPRQPSGSPSGRVRMSPPFMNCDGGDRVRRAAFRARREARAARVVVDRSDRPPKRWLVNSAGGSVYSESIIWGKKKLLEFVTSVGGGVGTFPGRGRARPRRPRRRARPCPPPAPQLQGARARQVCCTFSTSPSPPRTPRASLPRLP